MGTNEMAKTVNNYLRNRSRDFFFFFFDDTDAEQVSRANEHVRLMPRPLGIREPIVAFRRAPGLVTDGYVGVATRALSDIE